MSTTDCKIEYRLNKFARRRANDLLPILTTQRARCSRTLKRCTFTGRSMAGSSSAYSELVAAFLKMFLKRQISGKLKHRSCASFISDFMLHPRQVTRLPHVWDLYLPPDRRHRQCLVSLSTETWNKRNWLKFGNAKFSGIICEPSIFHFSLGRSTNSSHAKQQNKCRHWSLVVIKKEIASSK